MPLRAGFAATLMLLRASAVVDDTSSASTLIDAA